MQDFIEVNKIKCGRLYCIVQYVIKDNKREAEIFYSNTSIVYNNEKYVHKFENYYVDKYNNILNIINIQYQKFDIIMFNVRYTFNKGYLIYVKNTSEIYLYKSNVMSKHDIRRLKLKQCKIS